MQSLLFHSRQIGLLRLSRSRCGTSRVCALSYILNWKKEMSVLYQLYRDLSVKDYQHGLHPCGKQ